MDQDIRWKQRFFNFEKSFLFLKAACEKKELSQLEEAGIVQAFEFTFELAWKTLKDYLELKGMNPRFPRDTIKDGFKVELIEDGSTWIKMLEKRNELSHTYNEAQAQKAVCIIKEEYFPCLQQLYHRLRHTQ